MENLTPYFSDGDDEALTLHIQALLDEVQQLPHPQIKELVFELLGSIDMMHREAFVRMLLLIQERDPSLLAAMQDDTVIHSVLGVYELLPENENKPPPPEPIDMNTFIPIDAIGVSPGIKRPVWIPGGNIADIPPGTFQARKFEDVDVLLCNIEGELYALKNACIDSILPLSSGTLEGYILQCPWHGCRYDVRTGEILNGSGLNQEMYPIKVGEDGRFAVGFNIPKYNW